MGVDAPSNVISFECSSCRAKMKAPPEYAGRRARCKECGIGVVIPDGGYELGARANGIPRLGFRPSSPPRRTRWSLRAIRRKNRLPRHLATRRPIGRPPPKRYRRSRGSIASCTLREHSSRGSGSSSSASCWRTCLQIAGRAIVDRSRRWWVAPWRRCSRRSASPRRCCSRWTRAEPPRDALRAMSLLAWPTLLFALAWPLAPLADDWALRAAMERPFTERQRLELEGRCGAPTKRGAPCRNPAAPGAYRCRLHPR